jgi:hypothetical protein
LLDLLTSPGRLLHHLQALKALLILPAGTRAVPLDDNSGTLAISWDMRVHHVAWPWISDLNRFVPRLSIARSQRNGIAAIQVICAATECQDWNNADAHTHVAINI